MFNPAVTRFVCLVLFPDTGFVVCIDNKSNIIYTAVTDLDVVAVGNLMKNVMFREMLINKVEKFPFVIGGNIFC